MEYHEEELVIIELDVSEYQNFILEKAICNHGFFMMAPNKWLPEIKTLQRPIRLQPHRNISVLISVSQPSNGPLLHIRVHAKSITAANHRTILHQVRRMLRLSERDEAAVREFHKIHDAAKENGFGRLFRSVSLFEDIVKCFLLCNTTWKGSLEMVAALCHNQPFLALNAQEQNLKTLGKKRKKETSKQETDVSKLGEGVDYNEPLKNFPTPEELIKASQEYLRNECKLGYRIHRILSLAKKIQSGKLNLEKLNKEISHELSNRILKLKGGGKYTCANILMCLGFYHQIPMDSETRRLIVKVHGKEDCTSKNVAKYVEEIYGKYESFQCLAYWMDLLNDYESKVGKLSELSSDRYLSVNGSIDKVRKNEN